MSRSGQWRTISLGAGTSRLLIKTRFGPDGYLIQLTDLGRVWEEVADRDEIIRKARNSNCSFDPGADDDNYAALMKYIESALNSEPKTSLDMRSGVERDLEINLTASLPGDLPKLKWNICLGRLSDSAVAAELVNPLLLQVNILQTQVQQLVDEISAKDHVISKITDKFETGGNDLTAVFPGVSNVKTSRKKSQRSQLAGHVKGLADFDVTQWKASVAELNGRTTVTDEQTDGVFHDLPPSDATKPPDDWWEQLARSKSNRRGENDRTEAMTTSPSNDKRKQSRQPSPAPQDSMQDDDFERQETPPRVAKRAGSSKAESRVASFNANVNIQDHAAAKSIEHGDDETEDEGDDDLDGPSIGGKAHVESRLRQREKYTVPSIEKDDVLSRTASPHKLGVIGGKKTSTPQPPPEELPEPSSGKQRSKLGTFGGKTKIKEATPEPESPSASNSTVKSKLGTFGGKANKPSPPTTSKMQPIEQKGLSNGKIGKVGGRSATRTASPVKKEAETEAETAGETEKSEEQRANENRERLKRELEEKAKQPVKKKRKF